MPLRSIRKKLRLIRYYSAASQQTTWARATDIAMALTLLLAPATVWLIDRVYVSQSTQQHITGKLFQEAHGRVWAWAAAEVPPGAVRGESVFHGAFQFTIQSNQHGWPFASSWRRPRVRLDLDVFGENKPKEDVVLPSNSSLRAAIESALFEVEHGDVVAAWRGTMPAASNRIAGWLANGLVWYLLISYAAWAVISLSRFGWRLTGAARQAEGTQRRREGRCAACGYDLRGCEFSERCPECGTLVG